VPNVFVVSSFSAESVDKVFRFIRHDTAAAHLMSGRQAFALHARITPWQLMAPGKVYQNLYKANFSLCYTFVASSKNVTM
jgi:hypothetical protein